MNTAPFTALIVDDEPLASEGVRRLCEASGKVEVVGEALDGHAAIELIERLSPDAVFLDIAMPGMSGLDVAAVLRRLPRPPHVVLVTANDHFATEAFDLGVVDYVLKPIDQDRLSRAIDRLAGLIAVAAGKHHDLWVPYRGTIIKLRVRDVLRIEAERDYVRLIDAGRSYLLRATMQDIAERLTERHVRIHRSMMIARDQIAGLRHAGGGSWVIIDTSGAEFPIGRTYIDAVRALIF